MKDSTTVIKNEKRPVSKHKYRTYTFVCKWWTQYWPTEPICRMIHAGTFASKMVLFLLEKSFESLHVFYFTLEYNVLMMWHNIKLFACY